MENAISCHCQVGVILKAYFRDVHGYVDCSCSSLSNTLGMSSHPRHFPLLRSARQMGLWSLAFGLAIRKASPPSPSSETKPNDSVHLRCEQIVLHDPDSISPANQKPIHTLDLHFRQSTPVKPMASSDAAELSQKVVCQHCGPRQTSSPGDVWLSAMNAYR